MPRLKAAKRLESDDLSGMHHDDLFELVLLATGNESLANAYRVSAIKAATWKQR